MRPADTSKEAWKVFLEIQRKMSPAEKLRQTFEWSAAIRQLSEAGMRQRYPGADEHEIILRMAFINLGPDLFRKVYGEAVPNGARAR